MKTLTIPAGAAARAILYCLILGLYVVTHRSLAQELTPIPEADAAGVPAPGLVLHRGSVSLPRCSQGSTTAGRRR